MNLCGSPLLSGPDNFELVYGQHVTRLDNSTYRVYDFFGTTPNEAKNLCKHILTNYGGYPVLRIVYPQKEVFCCGNGLDALTIFILCLLGMILFCAVVVGYYSMRSICVSINLTSVLPRRQSSSPYTTIVIKQPTTRRSPE